MEKKIQEASLEENIKRHCQGKIGFQKGFPRGKKLKASARKKRWLTPYFNNDDRMQHKYSINIKPGVSRGALINSYSYWALVFQSLCPGYIHAFSLNPIVAILHHPTVCILASCRDLSLYHQRAFISGCHQRAFISDCQQRAFISDCLHIKWSTSALEKNQFQGPFG